MKSTTRLNALYVYPIIALLALGAHPALAQTAPRTAAAATDGTGDVLEQVIVTATRQDESVNKVAMSISAVTQATLTSQGVRTITELSQFVPGLQVQNQVAGVANFTIRGIGANTGAATTGVYLDDTALTKRSNSGVNQNNGSPLPVVYDLDRVEVLKGPQGTLYGGSSEGGTIRMITPTASLTTFSGKARADISSIAGGSASYEVSAAVGGPIIANKLGFRASLTDRHAGGYIDVVDPYQKGLVTKSNADQKDELAIRVTALMQVDDVTKVTLATYDSRFKSLGGPGNATKPLPAGTTFTTPAVCNSVIRPATVAAGQPWNPAAVPCPATASPGKTVNNIYMRPSATYGPFDYLNGHNSIQPLGGNLNPARTESSIDSVTFDRDFGSVSFKSVTSYVWDDTTGNVPDASPLNNVQTTTQVAGKSNFPLFSAMPNYYARFISSNKSREWEQEFRLSSNDTNSKLNWVAGLFASKTFIHIHYNIVGNYNPIDAALYGVTQAAKYGLPDDPNNILSTLDAQINETELAAFAEANYFVTPKLRVTAGLRQSKENLEFAQSLFGIVPNILPDAVGSVASSPLTPKIGARYQFTDDDFVYATAAKGFRAGGVNTQLNPALCTTGLALLGMTIADVPKGYNEDSVWSYEVGSKTRLLNNKLQLNLSAFRIDWSNVQTAIAAQGCGQNWTVNGGTAVSQGAEIQAQYRPFRPLTLTLNLGYDDAHYTAAVVGPKPTNGMAATVYFNQGDSLGAPPWQASGAAQYEFSLFEKRSFVRLDYVWTGHQMNGPSFGTGNYNPYTRNVSATTMMNFRAGMRFEDWDLSLYAKNLTDSQQAVGNAGNGIAACQATGGSTCTVYNNYNPFVAQGYQRPREIGIQGNMKF